MTVHGTAIELDSTACKSALLFAVVGEAQHGLFYFVYRQNSTLHQVGETNTSRHFACGSSCGQLHANMVHVLWPLPCRHDTPHVATFPKCSNVLWSSMRVFCHEGAPVTRHGFNQQYKKMSSTATSCQKSPLKYTQKESAVNNIMYSYYKRTNRNTGQHLMTPIGE